MYESVTLELLYPIPSNIYVHVVDDEGNGFNLREQDIGNFHIMFIDESRIEEEQLTCVIGLVVPAEKVIEICQEIDQNIKEYLGEDFSFLDGTINLKRIRRTKHAKSPFSSLSKRRRFNLSRKIYAILESSECTSICSIVEEYKDYQQAIKDGLYFILERFFYFLRENSSYGLVISDQPVSETRDYKNELIALVRSFEYWGQDFQERIYQDVFFTRDEWDPLIQITDLIAYSISSYVGNSLARITLLRLSEKYDFRYRLRKNPFYRMILPLIRKSSRDRISGYGIKC